MFRFFSFFDKGTDPFIIEQFLLFKEKRGKLPSFSVNIHQLTKDISQNITVLKKVHDYTFFLSKDGDYWISFCGVYLNMNENFSSVNVYLPENHIQNNEHVLSYSLMQAYMYRLVYTDNFMIHAAAVLIKGQAILFCGQSGAGKSTQANLWKKYLYCKILNYDKPCVINEGGNLYAHGSPWSGKEALYLNEFAPLKAIVFVRQDKENSVTRISPAQAFANLYLHNYVFPLNENIEKKYNSILTYLVNIIPVYELYCDISETAVKVLYTELFHEKTYQEFKKELPMRYKIKDGFRMTQIAEEYIVMPRGQEAIDFNATVVLNEAGAYMWNMLLDYNDIESMGKALAEKYNIEETVAIEDTTAFINKLSEDGMIESQD